MEQKFYYVIKAGLVLLCCVSAGNRLKLLEENNSVLTGQVQGTRKHT